jgi:hypothetical protein
VPVFCPGTVPGAAQRAAVTGAVAEESHRIAAIVINSGARAEFFAGLGDRVVSAPAVDAFGVVTDAAIWAALDVLC